MSMNVVVPEVSDGVTAGTVISIAVSVGDFVEEDQTLLELETDKAVVAIPSPQAGKIEKILVAEGDTADVGAVIVVLDARGQTSTTAAAQLLVFSRMLWRPRMFQMRTQRAQSRKMPRS